MNETTTKKENIDTDQTLRRVIKTLEGFTLYPNALGRTNLENLCNTLCIKPVTKGK